jgi:hypothetical protein
MDRNVAKQMLAIAEEGDAIERMAKLLFAAGVRERVWLQDPDSKALPSPISSGIANALRDLETSGRVGRMNTGSDPTEALRRLARDGGTSRAKALISRSVRK